MTVRSGMVDLVSQFRSYIQESGTTIFSDDRIQQILDSNSQFTFESPLITIPHKYQGSVVYLDYFTDHNWLEGTATTGNQIYNLNGTVVTNYTSDFINGRFTFDTNTRGTAYYLDARYFNFYKAVSEAWKEKAAYYATQFDFSVEGRSFKKSQIVQSCLKMAEEYESKSLPIQHSFDRGDMTGDFELEVED